MNDCECCGTPSDNLIEVIHDDGETELWCLVCASELPEESEFDISGLTQKELHG